MNFSSHIIINAPAETVWDIIGRQFDRIGDWATAIPSSAAVPRDVPVEPTVTGAPVAGRVCDTGIRMLPRATEMIIACSDSDRTLTYQATGMPAYVRVARNRWTVTAVDPQRTRAAFDAVFTPSGILGRLLAGWLLVQIGRTGRHLLNDLKHYAEHGVPSPRKQAQLDRAGRGWPSLRPRRSKGATGTRGVRLSESDPEGGQWPVGVAAVMSERGGEVDRPGAAQRADDQVPQGRHHVGPVPVRTWRRPRRRSHPAPSAARPRSPKCPRSRSASRAGLAWRGTGW